MIESIISEVLRFEPWLTTGNINVPDSQNDIHIVPKRSSFIFLLLDFLLSNTKDFNGF